ncbi:hypothetical protein II906_05275 [bacterium]|nr:hypothetical protein [bacterium]
MSDENKNKIVNNVYIKDEADIQLEKDLIEYKKQDIKRYIIIFIILLFIFKSPISYFLKFGYAFVSEKNYKPINVAENPVQDDYTQEETEQKTFEYTSLLNGNNIILIPRAHYRLSGMVIAHNNNFVFKSDFFDSAALYDLGVAWGKMADKKLYNKYFRAYSSKTELTGSRILHINTKTSPEKLPVSIGYALSHISHSHMVPANRNVMGALLKIRKWDIVEIEGELVDMRFVDKRGIIYNYATSLTRNDEGIDGDRGNGACETIYVTSVRIKNRIYR